MKSIFLIAASLGLLLAFGAFADPVILARDAETVAGDISLSANELRRVVTGKTVYLDVSGFELPIQYLNNGRMSGRMGSIAATLSISDPPSDNGRWWIEANQLCQRWKTWLEGETHCYRLTRKGNSVNWFRDDGRSGTARIED